MIGLQFVHEKDIGKMIRRTAINCDLFARKTQNGSHNFHSNLYSRYYQILDLEEKLNRKHP